MLLHVYYEKLEILIFQLLEKSDKLRMNSNNLAKDLKE